MNGPPVDTDRNEANRFFVEQFLTHLPGKRRVRTTNSQLQMLNFVYAPRSCFVLCLHYCRFGSVWLDNQDRNSRDHRCRHCDNRRCFGNDGKSNRFNCRRRSAGWSRRRPGRPGPADTRGAGRPTGVSGLPHREWPGYPHSRQRPRWRPGRTRQRSRWQPKPGRRSCRSEHTGPQRAPNL